MPRTSTPAARVARRAFEEGPWSPTVPERGRIIWRIGDLILEHTDELAQLESLDNGKPFPVAQAADVPLAADLFHYMAGRHQDRGQHDQHLDQLLQRVRRVAAVRRVQAVRLGPRDGDEVLEAYTEVKAVTTQL